MGAWAGLCAILGLSLFLAHVLRRSSALMPLVASAASMLFFTIFGGVGLLFAGGVVWYAACFGLCIYTAVKTKKDFVRLISPGLLLFAVASAVMILLFQLTQPMLTQWDEFTFWGTAAKATSQTHQLYHVADSNLIARSYPPGLVVFSYMMQFFGGYSESGQIAAMAVLQLACLVVPTAFFDKNKSGAVLCIAAMGLLPLLFETNINGGNMMYAYLSCMADMPMAVMFGAALCLYLAGGAKDTRLWIMLCVVLAALTNVKDIGLALALVVWVCVLADAFLFERKKLSVFGANGAGGAAAAAGVLLVGILGTYALWALMLAQQSVNRFDIGSAGQQLGQVEMLSSGVQMLFGIGRTEQFEAVLQSMMRALVNVPVFSFGAGVVLFAVIVAVTALAVALSASRKARSKIIVFSLVMMAGFAVFYVFNIFTYSLIFKPAEALLLKDYARYIMPYWLGWLMVALALLCRTASDAKASPLQLRRARAGAVAALCAVALMALPRFNWRANFMSISPSIYQTRQIVGQVLDIAADEGMQDDDVVYVVSQGDDGTRFYMYGFEMQAARSLIYNGLKYDAAGSIIVGEQGQTLYSANVASTLVAPGTPPGFAYNQECTPEQLCEFLRQQGCTHILLDVPDEYFWEELAPMFSDELQGWSKYTRGNTYYSIEWQADGSCMFVPQQGGGV